MQQLPEEVTRLGQEAFEAWSRFGEWLSARFGDVRVNSVGHLVVPSTDRRQAFMLGVDDTDHGIVADLHSPFLMQVPGDAQMIEVVAMNTGLATLGSVRLVPEEQTGTLYSLELRHQVHAAMLTQEWLHFYADLIPRLSGELVAMLQPAFGGACVPSASQEDTGPTGSSDSQGPFNTQY
ncbi:MAG: hypothetical protein ACRDVP_03025 [Acidimicrobiales bacterium]